MSTRDDFTKPVRELLARRVGYRCANPNCRVLTAGPGDSKDGTVDVGVAAHITAAANRKNIECPLNVPLTPL
jgi:hypothetical protein